MKHSEVLFTTDDGRDITFEDILKKIYTNAELKQKQIIETADGLKPLIITLSDAVVIMPSLIALQNAAINNDDLLVKAAAIIQRKQSKNSKVEIADGLITSSERSMLLASVREQAQGNVPGSSAGDE